MYSLYNHILACCSLYDQLHKNKSVEGFPKLHVVFQTLIGLRLELINAPAYKLQFVINLSQLI